MQAALLPIFCRDVAHLRPSAAETFSTGLLRSFARPGRRSVKLVIADDSEGLNAAASPNFVLPAGLSEPLDEEAPEVFSGPLHGERGVACLAEMRHPKRLERQRIAVIGHRHRLVVTVTVAQTS